MKAAWGGGRGLPRCQPQPSRGEASPNEEGDSLTRNKDGEEAPVREELTFLPPPPHPLHAAAAVRQTDGGGRRDEPDRRPVAPRSVAGLSDGCHLGRLLMCSLSPGPRSEREALKQRCWLSLRGKRGAVPTKARQQTAFVVALRLSSASASRTRVTQARRRAIGGSTRGTEGCIVS